MKLQDRINKDFKSVIKRANTTFDLHASIIGGVIENAGKDTISTVAAILSNYPDLNYGLISSHRTFDRLTSTLNHRWEIAAQSVEDLWGDAKSDFDILSRISVAFICKKSSPPWVNNKLDLKTLVSTDGGYDPRMGHIRFYFRKQVDAIMQSIQQGCLNGETLNQILTRVRKFFSRGRGRMGGREAARGSWEDIMTSIDTGAEDQFEETLYGPADISEGTYTLEDVERFTARQEKVQGWESRQYRPWFTDELKSSNRYLRDLEQILVADAVDQLHEGLLQIGSEEQNIEDFVWIATRGPKGLCDECAARDGMTMTEIKDKMKDKYKDQVPPLHPNCRCQLSPQLDRKWVDKVVDDGDKSWDPDSGKVYIADKQEKEYGITDMTLDEYMGAIPKP